MPCQSVVWCQVVQAFMVSAGVVVVEEGVDVPLQVFWQVIVVEQDAVFQSPVPAFDLALRHGVIRLAAGMRHTVFCQPGRQRGRDVARPVVAPQASSVPDAHAVEPGGFESILQRGRDVPCAHGFAQPPGDRQSLPTQSGRTSCKTSIWEYPTGCSVRRTPREDGSTVRMICSFSEAGYLMYRSPHLRSCFF